MCQCQAFSAADLASLSEPGNPLHQSVLWDSYSIGSSSWLCPFMKQYLNKLRACTAAQQLSLQFA